ncbi:MAG: mechanosensitive ion channel family protein [Firmicutes bacterium]|uniref:Mechanosensitive ion channel family protein n=1 Tax=Candidatus Alloenteromonas pullistercoris TaxID=2840785 RepID=A0A9D9DEZ4_9FIRM|nr:mechanosensitive ion channel family protein [Candidatus Enteromonas pullistercoris]
MPKKKKKSKKLVISFHAISIAIIVAAYVLLIVGSYYWKDDHWYQVFNPFAKFPTDPEAPEYALDMLVRIVSLCFVVITITHVVRLLLAILGARVKRGQSLASLLSSFAKYLGAIILVFAILGTLGIDTTVLLASAGILSLIVGLGAQPLIEDIFAGIFIVFEHTFEIGDIIVVDGFRGTVKEMGIRSTKIEDAGGDVKVINNSDIRTLINMTSKLSTAICDISISYSADIKKVEKVLADNLPAIKKRNKSIVNGPTYVGVQSLSDSAVLLRVIAECNETMRYQVQRDINRELKLIFDKNRISIPFPQIVVHQAEKEGE